MNQQLSNTLNLMRWIAAFSVVVGHLRSFLFIEYTQVEDKSILVKLFYFMTGFGHQAVMIFFVLSGYLVGGAILKEYKEKKKINKQYLKSYFIKRFSRIYIVLIPALVIGFILDSFGYSLFPQLYTNVYHLSAMNFNAYENLTLQILLGNIFNLQTITLPPLGTNGPLWSLANEWSYYLLLPLLFINNFTRIIFFIFFVTLAILNISILIYGVTWLIGALTVFINKKILHRYIAILIAISILLLSRKLSTFYIDILLGISTVFIINSIQYLNAEGKVFLYDFNSLMANFSFSVYLFHFPFFVFLISILYSNDINFILMQPTDLNLFKYFISLSFIYLYSYFLFFIFEKNTDRIKQYLIFKTIRF